MGREERLIKTEEGKVGDLVKISEASKGHWACRRFVGMVGRLSQKDEYSGWWVEFGGHPIALFHGGEHGLSQLSVATEADVKAAHEVERRLLSSAEDAQAVAKRSNPTLENEEPLSPRSKEALYLRRELQAVNKNNEALLLQVTAAWNEAALLQSSLQELEQRRSREAARLLAAGIFGAAISAGLFTLLRTR
mmetsp:Transcript_70186/g.168142  ORF Transcript_70186/g.168142 Transcript_70186/m.168142 type:complete len:192 (-) Transcript_70186:161-736(-)